MSLALNVTPALTSSSASPTQHPAGALHRNKENQHKRNLNSSKGQALANPTHRRRRTRQVASVSNQDPKVRAAIQDLRKAERSVDFSSPRKAKVHAIRRQPTAPSSVMSPGPALPGSTHRSDSIDQEMDTMVADVEVGAPPAHQRAPSHTLVPTTSSVLPTHGAIPHRLSWSLPRLLPRYPIRPIIREALEAVEPELRDVPLPFVMECIDQARDA
jgi:hypothetical protein